MLLDLLLLLLLLPLLLLLVLLRLCYDYDVVKPLSIYYPHPQQPVRE